MMSEKKKMIEKYHEIKLPVTVVGGSTPSTKEGVKIVGGGARPHEVTTLDSKPEPTK